MWKIIFICLQNVQNWKIIIYEQEKHHVLTLKGSKDGLFFAFTDSNNTLIIKAVAANWLIVAVIKDKQQLLRQPLHNVHASPFCLSVEIWESESSVQVKTPSCFTSPHLQAQPKQWRWKRNFSLFSVGNSQESRGKVVGNF